MEIFKLYGSIFVDSDQAKKSISDTAKNAQDLGKKLEKTGGNITKFGNNVTKVVGGVATAFTGTVAGITALAEKTAGVTDHIDKMSQKIGITRQAYQELDYVMSQNGMNIDQLQGGMKKLVDTMQSAQNGSKNAVAAFEQIGVTFTNIDGSLRSQEDVFFDTISALQNMGNEVERNALANDLFGRSASELIPLLNAGAGSMDELRQKARDLGLIMSDETIDAGVKLSDTMDTLKRSFEQIGASIGAELIPYVQEFAEYCINHMPEIKETISQLAEGLVALADVLFDVIKWFAELGPEGQKTVVIIGAIVGALGPVISAIGTVVSLFGKLSALWGAIAPFVTGTLIPAFEAVGAVLTGPILLAIGLVIAAIAVWKNNWQDIKDMFIDIAERIAEKMTWLKDKIVSVFQAMRSAIKLPHFKVEGSFSLNPPKIPKVGVDWYAKAMNNPMIMTSPTVFGINSSGQPMGGGEAGSEVVSGTSTLMDMIGQSVGQNSLSKADLVSAFTEALQSVALNVNANLSADSDRMFESMRVQNARFTKINGQSAFA